MQHLHVECTSRLTPAMQSFFLKTYCMSTALVSKMTAYVCNATKNFKQSDNLFTFNTNHLMILLNWGKTSRLVRYYMIFTIKMSSTKLYESCMKY